MNSVSTEVAWNKMMEMGQARQRAVWETCSESGRLLRNRARVPHFPIMSRSWAACACDECHQMRNIDKIQKNVRATKCSVFAPPTGWKWGSDPSAQASFFRHGKLFTNVIHLNEFHAVSMCLSRALMMTRKQWVTDAWLGRIWRDWMQWVRRWWRRDFRMNLTQSQHAQIQVFGLGVGDCGSPFHFHHIRSFNFWCKLLRLACPLRTSTVYSYPWTFMDWCRYRSINAQETLILWDEDVQTKTNWGRCNDVSSHPGTIDLSWFGELFAIRRIVSSTSIAFLVLKHWPTSVGFVNISFLQKLPQQMPATLVQVVSHLFFLWWKKHVITHPRQSQWSLTAKKICSWYGKWSSIARTCGLWWANGVNSSWIKSLWVRRSWTGILSWIHFYFEQKNLCTPRPYSRAYDCFAALLWSTFTSLPSVTQVSLRNASEHLNVVNRLIASFRRGWRMASFRHGKRKRTEIKNGRYLATMERFRNHTKQNHQLIPLVTWERTFRWNSLRSVG